MSWLVRTRSTAHRVRDGNAVTDESFGALHAGSPLLEWGSISKTVTAQIVRHLDDAGTIALSGPVREYLPETDLPPAVDVRSLVTHTSGLPRVPADIITSVADLRDPYAKYTNAHVDAEVLPGLERQRRGRLGTFAYSNLGYAVLTRLLERASGRDWWTLASDLVFGPLGIADVTVQPDPRRIPVLRTWTGAIRAQWTDTGPFIGAGGVHGTFDALERYAIGVTRAQRGAKPLGWMDSPRLWWHNGHNRDHGAFVGVSHDGTRVITVHTLGHGLGRADRIATKLDRRHSRNHP